MFRKYPLKILFEYFLNRIRLISSMIVDSYLNEYKKRNN